MANRILFDTLRHLADKGLDRRVTELHLTRYFSTVELDDHSIGACMSYYRIPDQTACILEERLQTYFHMNPFLIANHDILDKLISDHLEDGEQRYFLLTSLTATVISALSASFIRDGGDKDFEVTRKRPRRWVGAAESALVVGFGGLLIPLAQEPGIRRIHVIDFLYSSSRSFESQLVALKEQYPHKVITAANGMNDLTELRNFDVISITGSTLCNGTLENILANVRRETIVILQGQSASVHPKILFESGVKWIATTLKPEILSQLARGDPSGEKMRSLLDGNLPLVYLLPRSHEITH